MSRQSDGILRELGQTPGAADYLNRYLEALESEEGARLRVLAESALFDGAERNAARVQYGRLSLVREMRRSLESQTMQYTR